MRLKNILIVVKDIEASRKFYKDLFGLEMILDNSGNMILTEGLVLQEEKIWENFLNREVNKRGHDFELYFEESDIDGFLQKLEESPYDIEFINRDLTHNWGQRVVRFYDLDGHVIEVGTPLNS